MKIGVFTATNKYPTTLEVYPCADIGTIKSMIEVELGIPYVRQSISVPGKYRDGQIRDSDTVESLHIAEGDMIMVTDAGEAAGSPPMAAELVERSSNERGFLARLKEKQPELGLAVEKRDIKGITTALANLFKTSSGGDVKTAEGSIYSFQDKPHGHPAPQQPQGVPYYVVQPYYYGANEQYADPTYMQNQAALLYVGLSVCGVPVKAFVDCAAQTSTISESCVRMCNLSNSVDQRYRGYAGGPGSPMIIGRLHCVNLVFEDGQSYSAALSVLHSNVTSDIVLGLDFFKRHQCCIDMRYNCLRIGSGTTVSFMSPDVIRQSLHEDVMKSLLDIPQTAPMNQGMQAPRVPAGARLSDPSVVNLTMESVNPAGPRQTDTRPAPAAPGTKGHTYQTRVAPPRQPPPRQEPRLELNVDRSRRIHQQHFDEKNVGEKQIEEHKLKALMDLGADRDRAQAALRKCRGDTELAAAYLFESRAM